LQYFEKRNAFAICKVKLDFLAKFFIFQNEGKTTRTIVPSKRLKSKLHFQSTNIRTVFFCGAHFRRLYILTPWRSNVTLIICYFENKPLLAVWISN